MYRHALFLLVLALGVGPALAARERTHVPPRAPAETSCRPLAEVMKGLEAAKAHSEKMTPGQFHFLEGVYVREPTTPAGLPPGDGAILATGPGGGIIIWTHGSMACAPLSIAAGMIPLIKQIKTGKDEDVPVADPPAEGLKDCEKTNPDACAL